jgi:hypothetical protein
VPRPGTGNRRRRLTPELRSNADHWKGIGAVRLVRNPEPRSAILSSVHGIPGWVALFVLSVSLGGRGWASAPPEGGTHGTGGSSPTYRSEEISGSRDLERLRAELGAEGETLLQKINRRDLQHMRRGVVLQVPHQVLPLPAYSPFPEDIGQLGEIPKAVLVSLRVQAFAAYEHGRQVAWGPVSAGTRRQPTPPNLYHTNWRSPRRVSTINSSWIMRWYYNLHTSMGIAFHEYAMPGFPASYGCIRLLRTDARWLYDWADPWIPSENQRLPRAFGTPVVVFGDYDYESDPPWVRLADEPTAANVGESELRDALNRYLWAIEERTRLRFSDIPPAGGE